MDRPQTRSRSGMIRLVFTTFASAEDAARAVRTLVEERLAACGTILPGARSIYRWKDAIEDTGESLVLIKTSVEGFSRMEARLRAIHPCSRARRAERSIPARSRANMQRGLSTVAAHVSNLLASSPLGPSNGRGLG